MSRLFAAVLLSAILVSSTMGRMELCAQDDGVLDGGNQDEIAILFERAHELGVTHIRLMIYIHETAPCLGAEGQSNLNHYGTIVQQIIQNGFQPQLVLTGVAASWGDACGASTGTSPSITSWVSFVTAVVPYFYGLGARRFSMWNEPNNPSFLCAGSVASGSTVDDSVCHASSNANSELYARIYLAGSAAIRSLEKSKQIGPVQIFFGEFAGNGITTVEYIVRRHKIRADGYAWHPYQYCTSPLTGKFGSPSCKTKMTLGIGTTKQLAKKLKSWYPRLGARSGGPIPMYMTEFGYHIDEPGISLPLKVAAKWWVEVLDIAWQNGARGFNIYEFFPSPAGSWDTSILTADGDGGPSFYAINAWASRHGLAASAKAPLKAKSTPASKGKGKKGKDKGKDKHSRPKTPRRKQSDGGSAKKSKHHH